MTIAGGVNNCIYCYQHSSNIGGGTANKIYSCANSTNVNLHQNGNVSKNNTIGGGRSNHIKDENGVSSFNIIGGGNSNVICVKQNNTIYPWMVSGGNSVVGGFNNVILTNAGCSRFNIIAGGFGNRICCDESSFIGSGFNNLIQGCASNSSTFASSNFIGGGTSNSIKCNTIKSGIASGYQNSICRSERSFIGGGNDNYIKTETTSLTNISNAILGGQNNIICNTSRNSNILGGYGNRICSSTGNGTTGANTVIGGCFNTIACCDNQWNVILGGCSNRICAQDACYNLAFGCDIQIGCGDTCICYNTAFGRNNNICCCTKYTLTVGCNICMGGGLSSNEAELSTALGGNHKVCGFSNFVAGYSNTVNNHSYTAILGTYSKTSTQNNTTFMCNVCAFGCLTKATGTFKIDHPNPCKSATHNLQHSFVESPTAGDNLYRFEVEIGEDLEGEIILPEYYRYLNENSQVWVNPMDNLGRAFGIVNLSATKVKITTSDSGKYNVLVVATRKDKAAVEAWKGVETLKNAEEITNYKNSLKNRK
jgi:hypothetical protein